MENLTSLQIVGLSKLVKEAMLKEARATLSVGKHHVHGVVEYDGSLEVCEDETYIPTAEIPIYAAMIEMYEMFRGVAQQAQITNWEDMIVEGMKRAAERNLKGDDKSVAIMASTENFEALKARAMAAMGKLEPKSRKGKVLSKITMKPVA